MIESLVRWVIFSVIVALLPLGFNLLRDIGRGRGVSFVRLFSHGELLLVSAAISAGALGQLFGVRESLSIAKVISGGACVVILTLASLWFADISGAGDSKPSLDTKAICKGSMIIFACTVIASCCCVALGKV